MATKKFYLGSHGPFYYDDAELVNDPDGDFVGQFQKTITHDGEISPGYPTSGASGVVTVVTAIQAGGGGAIGFQYRTRDLTFVNGLISAIGAESGWSDV